MTEQRNALEQADALAMRQSSELDRRRNVLRRSCSQSVALAAGGVTGATFSLYLDHSQVALRDARAQQKEAADANAARDSAEDELRCARSAEAAARRAEEKTREFGSLERRRTVRVAEASEAECLEEVGLLSLSRNQKAN